MPAFAYTARQGDRSVSGTISATGATEAKAELGRRGLAGVTLKARTEKSLWQRLSQPMGTPRPRVKLADFAVFGRQFATMLSSGIPMMECLEILAEQQTDPGFRHVLERITEEVRAGTDLSEALKKYPRLFDTIFVSMVKAGEASGQLDDILLRMADYLEGSQKLRGQVRGALTFPVVSLVLVLGVSIFLLTFIIPRFKEVFDSMGAELPDITKLTMAVSNALKTHYVAWGGTGAVVGFCLWSWLRRTASGRWVHDWTLIHIPIIGALFRKISISRFAKTFATLIQSGVPILESLDIVAVTTGNLVIEAAVRESIESVRQGENLAGPLQRSGVFPPMVTRMIAVGEKTGAMETMLEKIGDFYDDQVESAVETLTSVLEPALIVTMSVVVGTIVVSVFMPIFDLATHLNK
ncbi:MAG: type II secretion system F family protein [Planctomycetes bacterium]|nr:type II secretion system F family protein [Planctomycetota bacterium]